MTTNNYTIAQSPPPGSIVPYSPGTIISGGPGDPTFNVGDITGRWDHTNITIAFASGGDFNAPITGANKQLVEQAIAVWNNTLSPAGSNHYTLVETADASTADIKIGFATNATGQLQQTVVKTYQGPNGEHFSGVYTGIAPGAEIRLQDPLQQAIDPTTGMYAGSTGTLLQAAEQGIGYALGLTASTDPTSVMNPLLTAQNLYAGPTITNSSDLSIPFNIFSVAPILTSTVSAPVITYSNNVAAVYRFFDTNNGTQFLTTDVAERNTIITTRSDLAYEGVGMASVKNPSADSNAAPVYRFFETNTGSHFFTTDAKEAATVAATRSDMKQEAPSVFEHTTQQAGDQAVYRFFDTKDGSHFYTNSASENASLIQTRPDMVSEGVAFYAPKV